ncbi:MAG TPA: hypothetical protein VHD90_28140 [Phototrophicaceae bacterium]|nr:hypothetical protein [Phototrophicaceae bacterium]
MSSTHAALSNEIATLITRHMETLGQYIPVASATTVSVPDEIVGHWERLNQICQEAPQQTSLERYQEACECHDQVRSFLQVMNQSFDEDFQDTCLGRIFQNALTWRRSAAEEFKLSVADVWAFIAPAHPDHLRDLGGGVYEAKWWMPVPVMDIEILKRTEGVLFCGEPFEPATMPGGLAVRFSISSDDKERM